MCTHENVVKRIPQVEKHIKEFIQPPEMDGMCQAGIVLSAKVQADILVSLGEYLAMLYSKRDKITLEAGVDKVEAFLEALQTRELEMAIERYYRRN